MEFREPQSHYIKVSDIHNIHVMDGGDCNGPCVLFIHGGPGSGVNLKLLNYIDWTYYRVILIDQRGAGLSSPRGEIIENSLSDLIADIEIVRNYFQVSSWLVTGGSWGCLLAVSYAVKYPDNVSGLLLRGCFLGRKWELDWLYSDSGAALYYPEQWAEFSSIVGRKADRKTILDYYMSQLNHQDESIRYSVAKKWIDWSSISMFGINYSDVDSASIISKARIMCHFLNNECFLKYDNNLIDEMSLLNRIPIWIVQGRVDIICPPITAWEISKVHENTSITILEQIGHSPSEIDTCNALRVYFEDAKKLFF
jgi:proline iminopeptidase